MVAEAATAATPITGKSTLQFKSALPDPRQHLFILKGDCGFGAFGINREPIPPLLLERLATFPVVDKFLRDRIHEKSRKKAGSTRLQDALISAVGPDLDCRHMGEYGLERRSRRSRFVGEPKFGWVDGVRVIKVVPQVDSLEPEGRAETAYFPVGPIDRFLAKVESLVARVGSEIMRQGVSDSARSATNVQHLGIRSQPGLVDEVSEELKTHTQKGFASAAADEIDQGIVGGRQ